jgi:hypothetical protein
MSRGGGDRGSINRGGDRNWGGGDRGGRHHSHRHRGGGVGVYVGPGYGYYDYGYSSGECAWLYRRAVQTGSSYWWRRYRNCID